jgi:hypothetical protein
MSLRTESRTKVPRSALCSEHAMYPSPLSPHNPLTRPWLAWGKLD